MRGRAKSLIILGSLCVALIVDNARTEAAQTTAMDMFGLCNSSPQSQDHLICDIYMAGFAQGIFAALSTSQSQDVCLPDYFNGEEALAIFNRYIKSANQNPAIVNRPVNIFLWTAIAIEFRCKK